MKNEKYQIDIPHPLARVFADVPGTRYRGAHGGRGSGKSFSFAKMLALKGLERKTRILCARELQYTLRDSSMAEIVRAIDSEAWMSEFYTCGESFIRGANGTEFIFRGLRHNAKEIKSLVGIGICWVEEAEAVSEESWRVLIPTIREPGSEIWITWNPESEDSATNQRFIVRPPPDSLIAELNWRDNPWFPSELDRERRHDQQGDPDMYQHIWEGACITRTDAQVLGGRWRIDSFEPEESWDGPYYGADWGFARDPTVLVRCWIHGRRLYVEHEASGVEVALDDTPALFERVPGARQAVIRADSARPETINFMRRRDWNVIAAAKWPGSVEDGVEFLRSFEIVIHERCERTAKEARLWSYKVDRNTGDVLPALIDANNHCWDAIRYSLSPSIRKRNHNLWFVQERSSTPDVEAEIEAMREKVIAPALGAIPSGVCGSCTSYQDGMCQDRGLTVGERDVACVGYLQRA